MTIACDVAGLYSVMAPGPGPNVVETRCTNNFEKTV